MPKTIKVGLITTLDTNIGDDFIRTGICHLLNEFYKGRTVTYTAVNKHKPYTVYQQWHPRILARRLPSKFPALQRVCKVFEDWTSRMGATRFDNCAVIAQCGAPVFWPECAHNEWAKPIWRDVVGRLHERTPVLNLAAGSCYPWESFPGYSLSSDDQTYIREILGYCRLTTVRDTGAEEICRSLGAKTPRLPCTAFLAAFGRRAELAEDAPILINYMAGGGHFDFGQSIDVGIWRRTVLELVARLEKRHRLQFLCHDDKELDLARDLAPQHGHVLPKSVAEYWHVVGGAKLALCNRMHASVGMAGMGIPSIAVGTDTRLLMVAELGVSTHFVKEVSALQLEEEIEALLLRRKDERERLLTLQLQTKGAYLNLLANYLPR